MNSLLTEGLHLWSDLRLFKKLLCFAGPHWLFSTWFHRIWQSMDILCSVASISHLLLISIERYICISSPLTYHSIVTTRKARVAIYVAWLFALVMTILKLVLWGGPTKVYQLTSFVLCFATPVLVMSYAYIMIFRVSRTQAKKMIFKIGEKTKRFCLPKELKAAKTLGVVMGAFVLCWFPFFFLNVYHALCPWVDVFFPFKYIFNGIEWLRRSSDSL